MISDLLEISIVCEMGIVRKSKIVISPRGARQNNKGWRIDYHLAGNSLKHNLSNAYILPDAIHSDHCPIVLELKF